MRLNDKAVSFVTGLILLLGAGTVVHKGDELFGSKANTTQIAKADIKPGIRSDAFEHDAIHISDSTKAVVLPFKKPTISDFEFVRAEQATSIIKSQTTFNALKINPAEMDCALNLKVKSLRGARVQLIVAAPCHKNKTVTITHAGLRFNEIINDTGRITIIIPVLSDPATIEVSFADGASKSISAPAKDLSSLQRSGIAWSGQTDLQLLVDENSYKAPKNNQVTAQNTRSYQQSYLLGGGYLTTLGNKAVQNGSFVQIYSIQNPDDIFVDFKVAFQAVNSNCGTHLKVKTIRYSAASGVELISKAIPIRNCSAKNKNIVLKNMLRNMIVAHRN